VVEDMSGSSTVSVAERKREVREGIADYNASDCVDRLLSVGGASLVAGGVMGAVQASWNEASHVGVARSRFFQTLFFVVHRVLTASCVFAASGPWWC
jgi:hypothetical protein